MKTLQELLYEKKDLESRLYVLERYVENLRDDLNIAESDLVDIENQLSEISVDITFFEFAKNLTNSNAIISLLTYAQDVPDLLGQFHTKYGWCICNGYLCIFQNEQFEGVPIVKGRVELAEKFIDTKNTQETVEFAAVSETEGGNLSFGKNQIWINKVYMGLVTTVIGIPKTVDVQEMPAPIIFSTDKGMAFIMPIKH